MNDTLKIVIGSGAIGSVEAVQNLPLDEVVKLGIQLFIGVVTLISMIRKRKEHSNG